MTDTRHAESFVNINWRLANVVMALFMLNEFSEITCEGRYEWNESVPEGNSALEFAVLSL